MADIYLDDLRFRDWWALYRIAKHPDFFYRALNDNHAWVWWRAARYILKAKISKHFTFMHRIAKAIRLKDTKELIGCTILVDIDVKQKGHATTGTFIAVPYQNKKIGTAARLRFIDWCLDRFDIQTIENTANPDNLASIRMQEYSGMKKCGEIPPSQKYLDSSGRPEPRIIMSASRPEIEQALQSAREQGRYTRDIPVL